MNKLTPEIDVFFAALGVFAGSVVVHGLVSSLFLPAFTTPNAQGLLHTAFTALF